MTRRRPLGPQTVKVLSALLQDCRYGFDVVQKTGLISATVYRALRRLEKLSFVRSQWEEPEVAEAEGRPRRRYYVVTRDGERAMAEVRREYLEAFRGTDLMVDAAAPEEAG